MTKYPVGIQDFREIREGGYKYIDKTPFVYKLINEGKYYFLSRPRRFGKSLLVSTLDYFFKGEKELFEGLFIYDKHDWQQTNPVIKISFAAISHKEKGLFNAINERLDEIATQYDIVIVENSISAKFLKLIISLSSKFGKVVVLIDEYDKPIIDYLGVDTEEALRSREIFKSFYSILKDADPYIKLVFITGVSKFSRISIFSDLNNLTDITIDNRFANCCGITEQELVSHFIDELQLHSKSKIKTWYNGYTWDLKTSVYNPFSILNFFVDGGKFRNYWFESGTPTFLINLTKDKNLYDFDNIKISSVQLASYDIEKLQLIPLMFQTGYLTLQSASEGHDIYTLGYPNIEVKRSYLDVLATAYMDNEMTGGVVLAVEIKEALKKCELDKLVSIVNSLFKGIPYDLWRVNNEAFYHAIIHLIFSLVGVYVQSEVHTSDGRLDSLVVLDKYIYCFEFKLDESAEIALQQIKDKGYLEPYQNQGKECIAIGINFSKELKKVEGIKWEKLF